MMGSFVIILGWMGFMTLAYVMYRRFSSKPVQDEQLQRIKVDVDRAKKQVEQLRQRFNDINREETERRKQRLPSMQELWETDREARHIMMQTMDPEEAMSLANEYVNDLPRNRTELEEGVICTDHDDRKYKMVQGRKIYIEKTPKQLAKTTRFEDLIVEDE